ncbi:MAG: hypothetical protein ACE5LU_04905 [Anaerolineae bacterium]
MRGCLQVAAGLLAALFVVTAVLALFTVNLAQIITDREAVKQILDGETLVVDVAPVLLAEVAWEQAMAQGSPSVDVNPAALQAAVRELLPPGWVEVQTDTAIDAMFDFLETGEPAAAALEVDIRPVLTALRGEAGRRVVLAVLQLLPPCTEPQSAFDSEAGFLEREYCLPSNVPVVEVARQTHAVVVETVAQVPQSQEKAGIVHVALFGQDTMMPAVRERLQQWPPLFVLSQRWGWLLWLIPLGCLFLILLLAVRSLGELGHWWGWPLVLAAVIAFFMAILTPAFLTATMLPSVTLASDMPRLALGRLMQHLLGRLTDRWLTRVYVQAGLMLACGILLLIGGYIERGSTWSVRS